MARLLAALPREEYESLLPHLRRVHLDAQQVLYWPDTVITRVYFPITSVLSVLVLMGDAIEVEAGLVGSEGILGLPVFLGATAAPHRVVVQIAGDAWRMPADAFREALIRSAPLREIVGRYAQAFLVQVAQGAGCNRVHTMEQRCARWLLMVQDRVGDQRLELTQEQIAEKLGVRRATVSRVMADLQRRGLLRYRRGVVTVHDRHGLEAVSCVCYGLIEEAAARLLGPSGSRSGQA